MDDTWLTDSEHIREELETLTNQLTQLQKMITAKKIILSGQEVMDAYYQSIDSTNQDQRFYL